MWNKIPEKSSEKSDMKDRPTDRQRQRERAGLMDGRTDGRAQLMAETCSSDWAGSCEMNILSCANTELCKISQCKDQGLILEELLHG